MTTTTGSDSRLLTRLKTGDGLAFEELVRANTERMLAVARRLLRNEHEAEDAVQEALFLAWRSIGAFDGRSAPSTWLHRITVNAALARIRVRQRHPVEDMNRVAGESNFEPADSRGDVVAAMEQERLSRLVWQAVDQLAEDQRTVLVLRDVEDVPSKEVASTLGLSDSAVRQRLHRARQAVAERLWPELCGTGDMSCGGRLDLLLDHIDGSVELELLPAVEEHVAGCPACSALLDKYRLVVVAPRDAVTSGDSRSVARLIDRILSKMGLGQ